MDMPGPADLVLNADTWNAERTAAEAALRAKDVKISELTAELTACQEQPPPSSGSGFDPSAVDWDAPPVLASSIVNGTEIENRVIYGKVSGSQEDVYLHNVQVEGRNLPSTGTHAVIDSSRMKRFAITQSIVFAPVPNVRWAEGVRLGPDGFAESTVCSGTVDGWGWWNPTAGGFVEPTMVDCGANSLAYFTGPSTGQPDQKTHNDCIQCHSQIGPKARILGGNYDAGPNGTAGFLYNGATVNGLTITYATFSGGKSSINFGPTPSVVAFFGYNVFGGVVYVKHDAAGKPPPGLVMKGNKKPDGTPANTPSKS